MTEHFLGRKLKTTLSTGLTFNRLEWKKESVMPTLSRLERQKGISDIPFLTFWAREKLCSQRKESHGNIYRSSRYENALKSLHSRYAYRENGLSGKSAYYEYLPDTAVIYPDILVVNSKYRFHDSSVSEGITCLLVYDSHLRKYQI